MSTKDTIQSIQKDLRNLLLRAKKEIAVKTEALKKTQEIQKLTKKEYQKLYNEHVAIKKQLQKYEEYFKSQQIQKRRKKREDLEREKKEIAKYNRKKEEDFDIINEIKKLKKLDLENYLTSKKRKSEPSDEEVSENEAEEAKPEKKKEKRGAECFGPNK